MNECELYHKWLGIPASEQPANHYRLLGLTLFENDPAVIENAADQRLGHLRTLRTSQHVDVAERMLNEVTAAKICLLKPDRKAKYDAMLSARMNQRGPSPAAPSLPQEQSPQAGAAADVPDDTPFFVDLTPSRRVVPDLPRKRMNPVVLLGPVLGIALVALVIYFKNLNSTDAPASIPSADSGPVVVKSTAIDKPMDKMDKAPIQPRPHDARIADGRLLPIPRARPRPREIPVSATGLVGPAAEPPNAAYMLIDQSRFWSALAQSQALAGTELLEISGRALGKYGARQLAALARWPARLVPPIALEFNEDETKIEVPVDAKPPDDSAVYITAWTGDKPPARKVVLQETPDPISVTFDASLHKSKAGLVVIHIAPRIGSGTSSIPCNLKRLAAMSDSLPKQIQDAKDKLDGLTSEIAQAQKYYQNLASRSTGAVGSNPAAAIAQKASLAAAESRLRMLNGKQASLIRSGTRWTTQLQELPGLINAVKGYEGTTFQYRVYYLEKKRQVVLLESDGDK